jgi:hypothetical protein
MRKSVIINLACIFSLRNGNRLLTHGSLETWDSYRGVLRLGRKTRLPEQQRVALWSMFARVRADLASRGVITVSEMFTKLAWAIALSKTPPFDLAVVDEARHMSVAHLGFLAALGAHRPDALFFAGDLRQRIFQQPFSACRNGHLDDFPWHYFVHNGPSGCKGTLRFFESGASLQTENLWVKCDRAELHAIWPTRSARRDEKTCRVVAAAIRTWINSTPAVRSRPERSFWERRTAGSPSRSLHWPFLSLATPFRSSCRTDGNISPTWSRKPKWRSR